MPTLTQRNFNKHMKDISKHATRSKSEKIYSYIQDKYISSYYAHPENNKTQKIKILNFFKYLFIIFSIMFGLIVYLSAPYSKAAAIPFTIMNSAIVLPLFGMIHPSLAFLDGKSRFIVIALYGLTTILGFVAMVFILQ